MLPVASTGPEPRSLLLRPCAFAVALKPTIELPTRTKAKATFLIMSFLIGACVLNCPNVWSTRRFRLFCNTLFRAGAIPVPVLIIFSSFIGELSKFSGLENSRKAEEGVS
jgi:hypothetical protein